MQFFYDGQIRRYLTQTIRVFSNFVVKYGDGTLQRVPVMYGDPDKQAASILRQNSENAVNSVPRIAVYITDLKLDRTRLSDSSYVGKMHFRERDTQVDPLTGRDTYNQAQGKNYTVERVMPTPFKLTMKVDIWAANTEQKLQLLEQILVLFNPSLELQTTDNYIDWTSLTTLELGEVRWSSKNIPVGNQDPIDLATLTVETPIWISPPAKVKHLGVITRVITSFYQSATENSTGYIDGLGTDLAGPTPSFTGELGSITTTSSDYGIQVYNGQIVLMGKTENAVPRNPSLEIGVKQGPAINWESFFGQYPGKLVNGSSRIYLVQSTGASVVGTIVFDANNPTVLMADFDPDTSPNDLLEPYDNQYNRANGLSAGTFDAIINPQNVYPGHGMKNIVAGDRFLIIDDIGSTTNQDGPDGWKNADGSDFVANANDIIEWDGSAWTIVFNSQEEGQYLVQTNIYTGVQYAWNNVSWTKSFEGEYKAGQWRIEL